MPENKNSSDGYSSNHSSGPWIVGITGASGIVYARRLLSALLEHVPTIKLEVVLSEAALRVMKEEDGLSSSVGRLLVSDLVGFDSDRVVVHSNRNIGASIASGSYPTAGMIVVPCSMRTLAAISCGYCDNLIQRAADVILKEQKKLVIVPRETPLSVIHLENMLKLARLGVSIVPAMPGFYHQPQSISDLVDMMVMRIIDQMGFRVDISSRWKVNSIVDDVRSKAEEEHVTGTNCFK